MNLWLRLLGILCFAWSRPRLKKPTEIVSTSFRVWPLDLDTSLHLNNGRYWTLMDLGRVDLMLRSGLWKDVLKNRWLPVVRAGTIRFRRELKLLKRFSIQTKLLYWDEARIVIEQRFIANGDVAAVALLLVGLYDRSARQFVEPKRLLKSFGSQVQQPELTKEVEAFLEAEQALRETTSSVVPETTNRSTPS